METIQKTIRTSLLKYGSLSEIIKKNGVLVMIARALTTKVESIDVNSIFSASSKTQKLG